MALCAPPPQLLACGLFGGLGGGIDFTAAELAVADQLVQLSCSTGGGDESSPSSSTAFSPRSVNTTTFATTTSAAAEYEEFTAGMGGEMELDRRPRKRYPYRLLSDLYAATAPAAKRRGDTGSSSRKRKRDDESPEIAGVEHKQS